MTTEPKVTNTQALYDSPEARLVGLMAIINRDGKPVHTFEVESDKTAWSDAGRKAAFEWLRENKPECDDPAAYWDEE